MLAIVDNMATLLQTLYGNIQYLIEHDSSSVQLNNVDSSSSSSSSTNCNCNYSTDNTHLNINDEDVLISFVTTTLIWFIVAIIIILSTSIISLIITNISFTNQSNTTIRSVDSDLEKQPL